MISLSRWPTRNGWKNLFAGAGFRDIRVGPEKRADIITGFDNYWDAIETGTGSLPQLYLSLSEADRHSVREKVRTQLSRFESDGGLRIIVEMLVASGRA